MSLFSALAGIDLGNTETHSFIDRSRLMPFDHFRKNGVWGTCTDCPETVDRLDAYPEHCINFQRSDHRLSLEDLVERYVIEYRSAKRRLDLMG